MKNKEITFSKVKETATIQFRGDEVSVLKYIDWELEQLLISMYVSTYFIEDEDDGTEDEDDGSENEDDGSEDEDNSSVSVFGFGTDYVAAERAFDYVLLAEATSINVGAKKHFAKKGGEDMNMILDYVYNSGLMEKILCEIQNLHVIRGRIDRVISDAKDEKNSVIGFIKELTKHIEGVDIPGIMKQVKDVQAQIADSPISDLMGEKKG